MLQVVMGLNALRQVAGRWLGTVGYAFSVLLTIRLGETLAATLTDRRK
jgi:hypothetical protein